MPALRVDYRPRPYVPDRYDGMRANARVGDLIRAGGRDAADLQLRQGDIAANLWGQLGQTVSRTVGDVLQARQQAQAWQAGAPERDLRTRQVDAETRALRRKETI